MTHPQAIPMANDPGLRDVPLNEANLIDLNTALLAGTPALDVAILNLRNCAAACVRGGCLDPDHIQLTAAIVAFDKAMGVALAVAPS